MSDLHSSIQANLQHFCDWLSVTPVSMMLQTVSWVIPTVQSVHILAISVVMGSAAMMDLKLLGWTGRGQTVGEMNRRFLPWVWSALAVLLCSGTILTMAEPGREIMNDVFRLKMALVLAAVALTLGEQLVVARNAAAWGERPHNILGARAFALTSLALWIAIAMCGRWIAYVPHE